MEEKEQKATDHGKRFASWTFPEFQEHSRGKWWYIIAGAVTLGLIIYGILAKNYLFAVFFALVGFIYSILLQRKPRLVTCTITEDGIEIHESFYAWKDLKSFWIIYEPPEVKTLYITFESKVRPLLSIPLEAQNPLTIREILLRYIQEDIEKDEELLSDVLQRKLKM